MAERTIISPHYSWVDDDGDLHTHWRGEIVELSDEEAAKGDALNCFLETRVEYPAQGVPVEPDVAPDHVEETPPPAPRRGGRQKKVSARDGAGR